MPKEMKITPEEAARILKEEHVIEVDTSREMPLRVVCPYFYGFKKKPEDIDPNTPEGVVFFNLAVCYKNQGNVSEGQIADVMYGFAQSGIPKNITMDGLNKLRELKYINPNTPEGHFVFASEFKPSLYYKWTQKFFDLLAKNPKEAEEEVSTEIKDTTVNKLED